MTINSGGVNYTIEPLSSNLDDVVKSVNAAGAGVTATKVAVGAGEYRLQFTATKSGEAGKFTVTDPAATFTDVKAAQDAEIVLWPTSPPEFQATIKSSTNTFTDLLPGVSVTAKEVSAAPVTLTVARDDAGITKLASDLVSGVNGIFSYVASQDRRHEHHQHERNIHHCRHLRRRQRSALREPEHPVRRVPAGGHSAAVAVGNWNQHHQDRHHGV